MRRSVSSQFSCGTLTRSTDTSQETGQDPYRNHCQSTMVLIMKRDGRKQMILHSSHQPPNMSPESRHQVQRRLPHTFLRR